MKCIAALSFFTFLAFAGCEPAPDTAISPDSRPVVEAYLVAGQPLSVKLTAQIPFSEDTTQQQPAKPIDGLSLTIKTGDQTVSLRSAGAGLYTSTAVARIGQTYDLSFEYLGNKVTASTLIPAKPASFRADRDEVIRPQINLGGGQGAGGLGGLLNGNADVNLTWKNPTAEYYFAVVDNLEINPVATILDPRNTGVANTLTRRFRVQPTQGDNATIQALSFQYFGRHAVALFHLNPDYAALYKQNSTSTQNISTPPTTVVNGLGIFTGMAADTLYLTVKKQ